MELSHSAHNPIDGRRPQHRQVVDGDERLHAGLQVRLEVAQHLVQLRAIEPRRIEHAGDAALGIGLHSRHALRQQRRLAKAVRRNQDRRTYILGAKLNLTQDPRTPHRALRYGDRGHGEPPCCPALDSPLFGISTRLTELIVRHDRFLSFGYRASTTV